jgi:hypothetical protein
MEEATLLTLLDCAMWGIEPKTFDNVFVWLTHRHNSGTDMIGGLVVKRVLGSYQIYTYYSYNLRFQNVFK